MLWWLAAMEEEMLDGAAGRHIEQVALPQPQPFLGQCLVNRRVRGAYLADGEGVSLSLAPEDHPQAAVAVLQRGHMSLSLQAIWQQFGNSIGQRERNTTQVYSTQETLETKEKQGFATLSLRRRNVPERSECWTVDPVLAVWGKFGEKVDPCEGNVTLMLLPQDLT
jgi:hypothetical protein